MFTSINFILHSTPSITFYRICSIVKEITAYIYRWHFLNHSEGAEVLVPDGKAKKSQTCSFGQTTCDAREGWLLCLILIQAGQLCVRKKTLLATFPSSFPTVLQYLPLDIKENKTEWWIH